MSEIRLRFISIASRWTGLQIYGGECASLKDALIAAVAGGANLRDAYLTGADLGDDGMFPDLAEAKADIFAIFELAIAEVAAVRDALINGTVDGSTYDGQCRCLIGTIAKARKCYYDDMTGIVASSSRPAEKFFSAIKPGHVPKINWRAALAVLWIDEWTAARAR